MQIGPKLWSLGRWQILNSNIRQTDTYKAEGNCSILVLLDLSAASDTVDHHTFLCDLEDLGITGFTLSWLKTYLTDRNFKVIGNDEVSEVGSMKYGIPMVQSQVLYCSFFIRWLCIIRWTFTKYHIVSMLMKHK